MRAYEVSYTKDDSKKVQYSDTQKSARTLRRTIMETESLRLTEVAIDMVEIPTKKEELLGWLNKAFA
jgi:hypothetical protein